MVLFIKHIPIEGPGRLEEYFRKRELTSTTIDLSRKDALPSDFHDIQAVITLGGPMNVYEDIKYPFLKEEDDFLRKIIRENIPLLGICLGSQLIAKAAGAVVKKAKQKELGWSAVQLTADGKVDPLFAGIKEDLEVFQWHEDTFGIPIGATLLGSSMDCPHQVFRLGSCVYGLQFHLEVTKDMIRDWIKEYFDAADASLKKKAEEMLSGYRKNEKKYHDQFEIICENFVKIILKENYHAKRLPGLHIVLGR